MPDDRADRLTRHARSRSADTQRRAEEALTVMAGAGEPPSVARLAARARVSRAWIYTRPELLDRLEQLRQQPPAASGGPNSRASLDSLRRRLELAHQHIAQLREENRRLRRDLALAHGERRGR